MARLRVTEFSCGVFLSVSGVGMRRVAAFFRAVRGDLGGVRKCQISHACPISRESQAKVKRLKVEVFLPKLLLRVRAHIFYNNSFNLLTF